MITSVFPDFTAWFLATALVTVLTGLVRFELIRRTFNRPTPSDPNWCGGKTNWRLDPNCVYGVEGQHHRRNGHLDQCRALGDLRFTTGAWTS